MSEVLTILLSTLSTNSVSIAGTDYKYADLALWDKMPAMKESRYDVVWNCLGKTPLSINDLSLSNLGSKLSDKRVGVVNPLPSMLQRQTFGATMEKIYLGCHWSKYYMKLDKSRLIPYPGMSYPKIGCGRTQVQVQCSAPVRELFRDLYLHTGNPSG